MRPDGRAGALPPGQDGLRGGREWPMPAEVRDPAALDDPGGLARLLVHRSEDLVFTKDAQGRYRYVNDAVLAVLGRPGAEVLGRTDAELWPAVAAPLQATDARVLAGETVEVEEALPTAQGGLCHWITRKLPLHDAQGRVVGLLGQGRDITGRKLAEAQRDLTRLKLQIAVQAAGLMLAEIDYTTNLNHISGELARLLQLGDGPTTVPRQAIFDRIHPEDRARYLQGIARAVDPAGDGHLAIQVRALLPDGTVRWIDIRLQVTFAPREGRWQPERGICAARDVTAEVQAQDALRTSEERFRAAAQAASEIVWTNDPQGRMAGPQPSWCAFTGQSEQAVQGYGWAAAVHPDDVQPTITAWKDAVAAGTRFAFAHRVRRHDGQWRSFALRALPVRDAQGAVREWVGVHTDITDIDEARQTIERQNAALREADARKDRFLATLSHELRNPLAPIRTAAELLARPEATPAQRAHAAQVVRRQVGQMALLLDDLLDVARITQGKLVLKRSRIDLPAVVDSAVETVRPLLERKGHALRLELPPQPPAFDADPVRLAQVLANLLTNAAKYTDPGGHIALRARTEGQLLAIEVADDGIGLAPEALPRLFGMFSQVGPGEGRTEGGLGVGLALVKALVELHGGKVAAHSDGPGRGSRFTVWLPLALAPALTVPAAQPPAAGGPRRVLVADDNRDAADTLALLLELAGHQVRVAYDGLQALAVAREMLPEVALLDIGMPGMDGHALARALRAEPWSQGLLLVAVTGWGQEEDRRRAREAGFDHHVTKPVEPAAVERVVALARAV
jgi:PAS domain S-box-containing protein